MKRNVAPVVCTVLSLLFWTCIEGTAACAGGDDNCSKRYSETRRMEHANCNIHVTEGKISDGAAKENPVPSFGNPNPSSINSNRERVAGELAIILLFLRAKGGFGPTPRFSAR